MGVAQRECTVTMYSLDFWAGGRLDIAGCEWTTGETRIFNARIYSVVIDLRQDGKCAITSSRLSK